jgi:hypothetical protein
MGSAGPAGAMKIMIWVGAMKILIVDNDEG